MSILVPAKSQKEKLPNIHFFISKFLSFAWSMCQQRVQWAGVASNRKQRLGQCRRLLLHLAGSVAPLLWLQCPGTTAQTPNSWGQPKKTRQPGQDFCEKKLREKKPSFPQKCGFENARRNLRPFLGFLVLVRFQGLFLKTSHQATFFFSLVPDSVELAMLPACDPGSSTKCFLSKSSKALQIVLVVPAWQGTLRENYREKNLMARFAPGVEQVFWPSSRLCRFET